MACNDCLKLSGDATHTALQCVLSKVQEAAQLSTKTLVTFKVMLLNGQEASAWFVMMGLARLVS